ncbi:MAG: prephenate/arogenate dehydrogenase family protein [Albidovulum sp.]|nr:prephenate/arogenate dehydrogenase family protein [Albidovulum sp.]
MTEIYDRVALIGMGLIGSSMALALRERGLVAEISCTSKTRETREAVAELGMADQICDSPEEAVRDADLVVLCTPVGTYRQLAERIGPELKRGATLSDVGSVKRMVIESVGESVPEGVHFIPAHPLAGTEFSGPRAGFSTLFENRWCLLTPPQDVDPEALKRLISLWEAIGANIEIMDPDHHDLVLAVTSHAPHLIAYTMVGLADHIKRVTNSEVVKYSAAGFRDFTRIAASDPTMWRDVFLSNRDATIEILGRFTEELFALQRAIRTGDGDHLYEYFTRTRAIRRGIIEAGQDTPAPDFGRSPSHKD